MEGNLGQTATCHTDLIDAPHTEVPQVVTQGRPIFPRASTSVRMMSAACTVILSVSASAAEAKPCVCVAVRFSSISRNSAS